MKIEIEKKYITASGNIIEIVSKDNDNIYTYNDNNYNLYTGNGKYWRHGISDRDLICEVVPSIYALYKGGVINFKELIIKHIEYYTK